MKKWLTELKKRYMISAGVALFLLPILVVHVLFKIPAPCKWLVANWTAGDILVYSGEVLGAAATILAIILTITFTLENQEDERKQSMANQKNERKLSIKPQLHTENEPIFEIAKAIEQVANRAIYIEMFSPESETFCTSFKPPYILTKYSKEKDPDFWQKYYIIQYTISNVGAGNALKLTFTINDINPGIPPFAVMVNNTRVFVIILRAESLKEESRSFQFRYEYQDIASIARYEQQETIVLFKEADGSLNSRQDINDVISQPKVI